MTSVGQTIVDVANQYGVDPVAALAQAWIESGLNPNAKGDYGTISGGSFSPLTPGTPGGQYTSFGLYQLHIGGELGNLTPQQAFNPKTNATVALSHVRAVEIANPGASPGEIAAIAGGPANPGAYALEVNQVYSMIAHKNYPNGFQAAFGSTSIPTSGVNTSGTSTNATLASANTSGTASTSPADASGAHGFLHEMQNVLNLGAVDTGWLGFFNVKADVENLAGTILARAAVIIVGAGFILAGALIIVFDVAKLTGQANKFVSPLERAQRLFYVPQRVAQAERRLTLQEEREVEPPSRQETFDARMARLRLNFEQENRRLRERGLPYYDSFEDFMEGVTSSEVL